MILSGRSIRESIKYSHLTEAISCDPKPTDEQYQPASLDVRLGDEFVEMTNGAEWEYKRDKITLAPGVRYLGTTKERISLPNDIAAQLTGRSSIGRQGIIVHKTAGWIDPGFEGEITLELMNLGDEKVDLKAGDRVAQMVFFQLDRPSSGYEGQYQNQSGATTHNND